MDSILITIKKLLGLDPDYHDFDMDVIMAINTALMTAHQVGAGKKLYITGETETWDDFLDGQTNIEVVKTYVYLKTRMIFDPPTSGTIAEAYNNQIKEYEYRLYVAKDNENYPNV